MLRSRWFTVADVNPEPWTPGTISTVLKKGKQARTMTKDAGLDAYQRAVADDLRRKYPDVRPTDHEVALRFFLWRQRASYEGERKKVIRNQVDATNMQKALEDALQGVLITNDRNVRSIETTIVEQGPDVRPFIAIHLSAWAGVPVPLLPASVESERTAAVELDFAASLKRDVDVSDVF